MIKDLLAFLDASPVNFLAVKTLKERLAAAGFKEMDSTAPIGTIEPGDQLFFTKNDSSLYAVRIGRQTIADAGIPSDMRPLRLAHLPYKAESGNGM